jgi:hypothetical protein
MLYTINFYFMSYIKVINLLEVPHYNNKDK